MKIIRNLLLVLIGIGLIAFLAFGIRYTLILKKTDDGLKQNQVEAINTEEPREDISPALNSETILLVGSDIRDGNNTGEMEGARSDTMMIVNLSSDRKRITAVSIPRDLMVKDMVPCYYWNPKTREVTEETWHPDEYTQSNSAFSAGGPQCAVRLAEHLSGIKIDRYVEVDFNGFKALVDAVGGVDINICKPMVDRNEGVGVLFEKPGIYTVDGEKALKFARARHVKGDTGSDTSRMWRQQYLIKQIIEQKINKDILLDSSKVDALAEAFIDNTRTDNIDVNFLLDSARATQGIEEVNLFTLPASEWEEDHNRLIDDETTTQWIFENLKDGKIITAERASKVYAKMTEQASTTNKAYIPSPSATAIPEPVSNDPTQSSTPGSSVPPPTSTTNYETEIPCGWGG